MLSRLSRSMSTIANLQRMSAKTLSEKILAEQGASAEDSSIAIIDVRDNGNHPFSHIHFRLNPACLTNLYRCTY